MNSLIQNQSAALPVVGFDAAAARQLIDDFYAGRKGTTLTAYRQALDDFSAFLQADCSSTAAKWFLSAGQGGANAIVLRFRADMVQRDLAASTINTRLSAVRSLVKLARTAGLVNWSIEVSNVKSSTYRDTRGPGQNGVRQILGQASTHRSPAHAARDVALVRLMYDLGLRRGSVVAMDVGDVDLEADRVELTVKGQTDKQYRTLPTQTAEALRTWLEHRGDDDGPLFINFHHSGKGGRLTGRSVHRIVKRLGENAGLAARPHGLRHSAITDALDKTNGDVRAVQKFSGHADVRTLMIYDDNRRDDGGRVSKLVADGLDGEAETSGE
jgi:integrase/recombinase XerC